LLRTKVLLVEMPQMLRDIIKEIVEKQPDMEVVGTASERADTIRMLGGVRADVVVIGLRDSDSADDLEWLWKVERHLAVLGLTADARQAFLYLLRPERTSLGEVSPEALVAAIHAATASSG